MCSSDLTGLGLATVYGAVTQLGGEINMRSAPGQGTTVEIRLPLEIASGAPAEVAPRGEVRREGRVLLVDDERDLLDFGREVLTRARYEVTAVATPDAALELANRALKRVGFSAEDAKIIADQLIDNALCGYRFASLPRILAIAGNNKTRNERRPIKVVHETPMSALIDGGNNLGYVSVYRATELAIEKAKKSGFAMVGVYDSYYSGRSA